MIKLQRDSANPLKNRAYIAARHVHDCVLVASRLRRVSLL